MSEQPADVVALSFKDIIKADQSQKNKVAEALETTVIIDGAERKIVADNSALSDPEIFFDMAKFLDESTFEKADAITGTLPSGKTFTITNPKYKQTLAMIAAVIKEPKWTDVEWALFASLAGITEFGKVASLAMVAAGMHPGQVKVERASAKKGLARRASGGRSTTRARKD